MYPSSATLGSTTFNEDDDGHDLDRQRDMSLDRSPSPHRAGGWSSPGLSTPMDDGLVARSRAVSPGQAHGHGVTWASAKQRSERVNGYPSYQSQNQGFFARHMRRLSEQLPTFTHGGQEDRYAEKEKLGRGRTGLIGWNWKGLARRSGLMMSRRRKYVAMLVLAVLTALLWFNKREWCMIEMQVQADPIQPSHTHTDERHGLVEAVRLS